MKNQKRKELTGSLLLKTYFENNAKVEKTLSVLRAQGYKFGNATARAMFQDALKLHVEALEDAEAGNTHPTETSKLRDGKYFITAAQNNTKVHTGFFDTVQKFCSEHGVKLIVSKFTYKRKGFENMTSELADDLWYDTRTLPYLMNEQIQLGDFIFYGNFDILPTAAQPLSGLESHSGSLDCAFPHTKLQMRSIATMPQVKAKHMYTTGCCTLLNYVPRKAGQKAELHHVFGGLYVEVKKGKTKVTPISADARTGEFSVYDTHYTPKGSTKQKALAVNFGDIHLEKLDSRYSKGMHKVLNDLQPANVFLHDLLDFEARNHHEVFNKFARFAKHMSQKDNVERNVTDLYLWLTNLANKYPETTFHVVPSNHNDAFYKWANTEQPFNDYPNLKFWHMVNWLKLQQITDSGEEEELLVTVAKHLGVNFSENIAFHNRSESVRLCGIEFNLHGDMGANGSRGTPQGLAKLGFKANTGHTHSAGIHNGVYVAGVSGSLEHGYNVGLSSWSNAFVVTYIGGKRTVILDYPH